MSREPESAPPRSARQRPRVALALGGGGARGLTHIGILRVLARHGVDLQAVAGTSIGAVVGGVWAAGLLDKYEEFVRGLDLKSVLWFIDPTLARGGLMGGKRLWNRMDRLVGTRRIEDLPIPYLGIAADLRTGEEVRLDRGELTLAMRASTCIPGLMPPVWIERRWLVDGGLAAPVPVQAARSLRCDVVIAVDLHGRSYGPEFDGRSEAVRAAEERAEENRSRLDPDSRAGRAVQRLEDWWSGFRGGKSERPPNVLRVVNDGISHVQARLTELQLERDRPELILRPQLPGVGLLDFHRADELIETGERTALEALESGAWSQALARAGDPA